MRNEIKKTQHFSTRAEELCGNLLPLLPIEDGDTIVEPFAGQLDLVNLFTNLSNRQVDWELYDIVPAQQNVMKRDTILNPPDVKDKWVITNPPYLARNKAKDKAPFDKYGLPDLYKIAVSNLIGCKGGMLIIPTNFFLDERGREVIDPFMRKYKILHMNIFNVPMFENTTYSVCAFSFVEGVESTARSWHTTIYNKDNTFSCTLAARERFDWRIGGDILVPYEKEKPIFGRVIGEAKDNPQALPIRLVAIDKRNEPLHLEKAYDAYEFVGKPTDRTTTVLTIEPRHELTLQDIDVLVEKFNDKVSQMREDTHNLIFTNYRDYGRKRISFDLAYKILTVCYKEIYGRN